MQRVNDDHKRKTTTAHKILGHHAVFPNLGELILSPSQIILNLNDYAFINKFSLYYSFIVQYIS